VRVQPQWRWSLRRSRKLNCEVSSWTKLSRNRRRPSSNSARSSDVRSRLLNVSCYQYNCHSLFTHYSLIIHSLFTNYSLCIHSFTLVFIYSFNQTFFHLIPQNSKHTHISLFQFSLFSAEGFVPVLAGGVQRSSKPLMDLSISMER